MCININSVLGKTYYAIVLIIVRYSCKYKKFNYG
jgi:hypothetical protein